MLEEKGRTNRRQHRWNDSFVIIASVLFSLSFILPLIIVHVIIFCVCSRLILFAWFFIDVDACSLVTHFDAVTFSFWSVHFIQLFRVFRWIIRVDFYFSFFFGRSAFVYAFVAILCPKLIISGKSCGHASFLFSLFLIVFRPIFDLTISFFFLFSLSLLVDGFSCIESVFL